MTRTEVGVGPEAFDGLDERVDGSGRFRATHRPDGSRGRFDDTDPPPVGSVGGRGVSSRSLSPRDSAQDEPQRVHQPDEHECDDQAQQGARDDRDLGPEACPLGERGRSRSPALVGDRRTESTDWSSSSVGSPEAAARFVSELIRAGLRAPGRASVRALVSPARDGAAGTRPGPRDTTSPASPRSVPPARDWHR